MQWFKGIFTSKQVQTSKLIQDQNYSHNVLFTAMSTAQALSMKATNISNGTKKFEAYDKTNYSDKTVMELKAQMNTQLHLVRASFIVFESENKGQGWKWPSNYSKEAFSKDINQYQEIFQNVDADCASMMMCFKEIVLEGKCSDLWIDKKNYRVEYSQEQIMNQNKKLVQNSYNTSLNVEEEAKRVEGVTDSTELRAKINDIPVQNWTNQGNR